MRRARSSILVLLLAGAITALAAWSQDWFTFDLTEAASATQTHVSGNIAAGFVSALAFGILAACAALTISPRVLRLVILIVALALSISGVASVATAIADPISSSLASLSKSSGVADVTTLSALISKTTVSIWPLVSIAGFAVCFVGSTLGLATSWKWASGASRFNRPESSPHRPRPDQRNMETGEAWDTLSHGDDPTG